MKTPPRINGTHFYADPALEHVAPGGEPMFVWTVRSRYTGKALASTSFTEKSARALIQKMDKRAADLYEVWETSPEAMEAGS